jgi:hypothetical protein
MSNRIAPEAGHLIGCLHDAVSRYQTMQLAAMRAECVTEQDRLIWQSELAATHILELAAMIVSATPHLEPKRLSK